MHTPDYPTPEFHASIDLAHLPAWAARHDDRIGDGITSIVYRRTHDTIDMLTRDHMKAAYLCQYLGYRRVHAYAVPHPMPAIACMDVHHLIGPYLHPIDDVDALAQLITAHEAFHDRAIRHCTDEIAHDYYHASFIVPGHPMHDAVEFKYRHPQCADISLDVHPTNFMQGPNGDLVGNDLILHAPLYDQILTYFDQIGI